MDSFQNIQPVQVESGQVTVDGLVQVSDIVTPIQIGDMHGNLAHISHEGLVTSDELHHSAYLGTVYQIGYRWDTLAALATAGILIHTPQSLDLDVWIETNATGLCTIDFREQPTVTALGTPVLAAGGVFANQSRDIGDDAFFDGFGAYIDPTVNAGSGKFLVRGVMGGAGAGKKVPPMPGDQGGIPWILRPGIPYYLEIVNTDDTNAIYVAVQIVVASHAAHTGTD